MVLSVNDLLLHGDGSLKLPWDRFIYFFYLGLNFEVKKLFFVFL